MTNPVSRQIAVKVLFQWDGSTWTDETQYVISMKGTQEYFPPNESYQSGRQIIQQASVTLANLNYRFSPWHSDSVLYSQRAYGGSYHRKCRMQIQEDGGAWVDLFFGYVKTPGDSFGRNQVTFTIWDMGEILREKKSTIMLENYQEHDLVIYYLSNVAGRVDGVDFTSPTYAAAHGGQVIDHQIMLLVVLQHDRAFLLAQNFAHVPDREGDLVAPEGIAWGFKVSKEQIDPCPAILLDLHPAFAVIRSAVSALAVQHAITMPGRKTIVQVGQGDGSLLNDLPARLIGLVRREILLSSLHGDHVLGFVCPSGSIPLEQDFDGDLARDWVGHITLVFRK
jgi:hypothetical protein